jgi:hypothetical protein
MTERVGWCEPRLLLSSGIPADLDREMNSSDAGAMFEAQYFHESRE